MNRFAVYNIKNEFLKNRILKKEKSLDKYTKYFQNFFIFIIYNNLHNHHEDQVSGPAVWGKKYDPV